MDELFAKVADPTGKKGGKDLAVTSNQFKKMFKDAGLFSKKFSGTDCELGYTSQQSKAKAKKKNAMDQDTFREAIGNMAIKRYPDMDPVKAYEKLLAKLTGSEVKLKGTKSDDVEQAKKENSCGVYARGGPQNVDKDKIQPGQLTNRSNKADVKGGLKKVEKTNLQGSDK